MKKFKDLTSQSLATLKPHILFWSMEDDLDLNLEINKKLDIETTAFSRCIAEYAINYAIQLDDKDLAKDLCKNGARLDVRDSFTGNKTPLELAIDYGRAEIVDILTKHGACLPNDAIVPSDNLCSNPSRFFWALNERMHSRQADYKAVEEVLYHSKRI